MGMNISVRKYSQAPTTSPGFGMGGCHYEPSRFTAKRNLLLGIGESPTLSPLFLIITAASDACEFRSPTSSRGDNGVVGLTPWHSVRAPLRSHVPLAGRVMSAVYPPSCGASIGGVPRFTICEVR